ncbi:MAG: hypothetical protein LBD79_11330 [Treponema sp.]|jgi:hypothetical protein|nr:hypothetical protein [Treponema sp.]
MRKTLLMGGAVLLVLALVFTGCDNSYDVTNTDTIPSLSGPGNLKAANSQKGVITLTWDRDYNVLRYDVYRQTGDEPAVKLAGTSNPLFTDGLNRYDDIVSDTNPLTVDTKYTYTVVAISATSTSQQRSIDVVQNGVSKTDITIPATPTDEYKGIPAKGDTTVVTAVTSLAYAKIKTSNGNDALQISWDKNSNPGVWYRLESNGQSVSSGFSSSIYGSKVVYTTDQLGNLSDGEKYKASVTAFYNSDYYKAAAPVSVEYTHSDPSSIISNFNARPITLYTNGNANGSYNVSLFWNQSLKAPAGVTYKLYRHEGTNIPSGVEWEAVSGVTIPSADGTGFIQVTLDGTNVPAYRQVWTFKVVATVNGEEVDESTIILNNAPWTVTTNIQTAGGSYAASVSTESGRKVTVAVQQVTSGLYSGDSIEFYAAPYSFFNSDGNVTSSDQYLSQFTSLGSISKADLEGADLDKRTKTGTVPKIGSYRIIAVLKNGDTKESQIPLYYSNGYSSQSYWYVNVSD